MDIAICDDDEKIRDILAKKVLQHYPHARMSFYQSGEELLLSRQEPDILFLDIQMQGKNGMETARELRAYCQKTILIFVTAIEEYVFQAFDVGAFHYLVKPFTDEKFETVLKKAVEISQNQHNNKTAKEEKFLLIKAGGTHTKVYFTDIVYAEIYNRKVILHMADHVVEYYGKLQELEEQTGEDFFRSHRAFLIHFKYVVRYNVAAVYLEYGTALMAKKNYPAFVKSYLKYNQREGDAREK